MKRKLTGIILALLTATAVTAQTDGWHAVTEKETAMEQQKAKQPKQKVSREEADQPYLKGAVPEVDGQVSFIREIDAPGKTAEQLFEATRQLVTQMAQEERQIQSRITLVNEGEHSFAARFNEWMVFSEHLLAVDRTEFHYSLVVICTDGHLTVGLNHLSYIYSQGAVYKAEDWRNIAVNNGIAYKAEEWISDREAINKKGTKLNRAMRKFRIKTVDRVNEIFEAIQKAVQ